MKKPVGQFLGIGIDFQLHNSGKLSDFRNQATF